MIVGVECRSGVINPVRFYYGNDSRGRSELLVLRLDNVIHFNDKTNQQPHYSRKMTINR